MQQIPSKNEIELASTVPLHIRESLKKFESHETITCLECGYHGMMGIKSEIVPWFVSWWFLWLVLAVPIYFGVNWVIALILAAILVKIRIYFTTKIVVCPNCNEYLSV